jgi:hypothetical protein
MTGRSLALLLTVLLPEPAFGHPDYEWPLRTVQDGQGRVLTLVLHYRDGIVGHDLVKLVIYAPDRAIVAETGYYRDVLVYESSGDTLHVFGVGEFSLLFEDAWAFEDRELVPTHAASTCGYALLAGLRTHWLGYSFSVLLCWAGAYSLRRKVRAERWWLSLVPLTWLLLLLQYGWLSVPLILVLAELGIVLYLVGHRVIRRLWALRT